MAFALTGLISPPPPLAGAPAADIAAYCTRHQLGLEIESVADGVGASLLVIFAAAFHSRVRTMPSLTAFGAAILGSGALPRWLGLTAAAAAGLQAVAWISFFAPAGILAAGGLIPT